MDNLQVDVTAEGRDHLRCALAIAFGKYRKAVGYVVEPKSKDAAARLIFFWHEPNGLSSYHPLPFKLDLEGAVDFVERWLAEQEYGPEPDHDGDNGKGWRAYNEAWGHVAGHGEAFVAVTPVWAMYGK